MGRYPPLRWSGFPGQFFLRYPSGQVHLAPLQRFIEWFTSNDESIVGKSKTKAYALFDRSFIEHAVNEQEQEVFRQFTKGLALLEVYDHEALDSKGNTRRGQS